MAWIELRVDDRCHFGWSQVRQALHDLTYVAIVCHIGNPSRVECVSIVASHKLQALSPQCWAFSSFFFFFFFFGGVGGGVLTITDLL